MAYYLSECSQFMCVAGLHFQYLQVGLESMILLSKTLFCKLYGLQFFLTCDIDSQ